MRKFTSCDALAIAVTPPSTSRWRAALLLATEGCEAAYIKQQWLAAINELLLLQLLREYATVRAYHQRRRAACWAQLGLHDRGHRDGQKRS